MDEHSDIDYMIVFSDGGYTPQTYLDRLRRFVNYYYSTSEIKQSSPTIVLQLNHIKFDLVPALNDSWSGYQIPNGTSGWQNTNPNDFNSILTAKNNAESSLIKPTIRLAKFWNAQAGYVYDSFEFEKWIVSQSYGMERNQKDYFFTVFDKLGVGTLPQRQSDRVNRAKLVINNVRRLEADGMPHSAEGEIKKIIPE